MKRRSLILFLGNTAITALVAGVNNRRGGAAYAYPPNPSKIPPEKPAPELPPTPGGRWSEAEWEWMYEGGDNSLVHLFIGGAEGTRGPHGEKWPAYHGHTDPGNGVWNKGSFSYQHGPSVTPAQADAQQLARLRGQAKVILDQAASTHLILTTEAFLNALDLANQSPMSGLGLSGRHASHGFVRYLSWHVEAGGAHNGIYTRDDIVMARTKSYIHRYTGTWTATGLGANPRTGWSDEASRGRVWRDQQRRYDAGFRALTVFRNSGRVPEGF